MTDVRPESTAPARFGPWRRELSAFLELLALAGVAVAQPTFDILSSDDASVFVSRGTGPASVILFTLAVVLVPPAVLWAAEVLVGLVLPRARRWVHGAFAAVIVGVIAVEVLKQATEWGPRTLVAVGVVAGIAGGALILRFALAWEWLRYLAFAPVVFAVLFLFFSPVSTVVFSDSPKAAASVDVDTPSRVVTIVMDEFPTGSLLDGTGKVDATLFPNFAKLAAGSTWYRNVTTVAPNTDDAVPAIVTGSRPRDDVPAIAASYPRSIFTLLGGSYEMNVHESITRLCPTPICPKSTAPGPRSSLVDEATDAWTTFASPNRASASENIAVGTNDSEPKALVRGEGFVDSLEPGTTSKLDYLHVLMPHEPWHYIGTGQDYEDNRGARGLIFYTWGDEWVAQAARLRHLLQVQATDRLLGQVITKLERMGAYDDSLVVVTADHGVAFTANQPIRGVSEGNASQIAWTPLFVKAPQQAAGRVDDRPVRSIDLLPTMADMLDVELPWKIDGHSVLGTPTPDGPVQLDNWGANVMQPPEGSDLITLDGASGFAETLAASASRATGDPALRLYRIGEFGDLIGRRAAPLRASDRASATATIEDLDRYDDVDVEADLIDWAYLSGTIEGLPAGRPLVITANGTVVASSQTYRGFGETDVTFWATLPPTLMRDGRNTIGVAVVQGTPDAPTLVPLRVTS